jgi:multiple sugar transport system ATP-binding protein
VPAPIVDGGGASLIAGFRPEHVRLANGAAPDSIGFSGRLEAVEYLGEEQLVHVQTGDRIVLAKLPAAQELSMGEQRSFTVPRSRLFLFDAETEERIN